MKKKSLIITTDIKIYYLTLAKKHWWSKWKLVSIGDNEYSEKVVKLTLKEK